MPDIVCPRCRGCVSPWPRLCVHAVEVVCPRCRSCVSPGLTWCVPGAPVAEVAEESECCCVAYPEVKWQQSSGNEASCRKIFPKTSCPRSRAGEEWQNRSAAQRCVRSEFSATSPATEGRQCDGMILMRGLSMFSGSGKQLAAMLAAAATMPRNRLAKAVVDRGVTHRGQILRS